LTPGTTYYFRAVSHASLAISQEHSFTTLATKEGTGQGGAEGEVKGASTFLPATGFDFNEFVILAMILLALIGLRVILKKKSAAIS